MRDERSSTVGLVLSITTERPACSAASMSCACLLARFLLLRIRSLLTCSCVVAKCVRKNVLLPDACRPIKMTNSIKVHLSCRGAHQDIGVNLTLIWRLKPQLHKQNLP